MFCLLVLFSAPRHMEKIWKRILPTISHSYPLLRPSSTSQPLNLVHNIYPGYFQVVQQGPIQVIETASPSNTTIALVSPPRSSLPSSILCQRCKRSYQLATLVASSEYISSLLNQLLAQSIDNHHVLEKICNYSNSKLGAGHCS